MGERWLKVEDNIPMPDGPGVGRRRKWLNIILQMKPGESIGGLTKNEARQFLNSAHTHNKYSEDARIQMSQRKQGDGTYRVWRVR